MESLWIERFEELQALEPEWRKLISEQSRVLSMPPKTSVFSLGKPAENMIFLLQGSVRVQQVSEGGREIVLYRIEAGQSCIMTASCLIGHQDYAAEGVSETDIKAAIIPRDLFDQVLAGSAIFRNFVFSTFSMRLTELMVIINEVAFRRLDIRLAQRLLDLAKNEGEISATHQQLAVEIGTAREVISRQLQEFNRRDWVQQSRGCIVLTNIQKLKELATKLD
jgi:CRP/FNR family transcriptional regulator